MSPRRQVVGRKGEGARSADGTRAADGTWAADGATPSTGGEQGVPVRPVDRTAGQDEAREEVSLRPRHLAEFVGQRRLLAQLEVVLAGARGRGQPLDHVLFAGPPGLGKTTLAGIVAREMGASLRITSGPALVRSGDVAELLNELAEGDVLFIDEIHRLPRVVEEVLYPAMEDFQLDIVIGKGPMARSIRLPLPRFTLVGATTRTGLVAAPLRDRFGFVGHLELYEPAELEVIVRRAAGILGVELSAGGAEELARRSRGTPRIANRLLRLARDFAQVKGSGVVDRATARAALELFGVDERGLDRLDLAVLTSLCLRFGGRPVGLTTLAVAVGEEPETVEDVAEPFLLQQGLLQRTPRGRVATPAAWRHLGVEPPVGLQLALADEDDPAGPLGGPSRDARPGPSL